MASEVIKLNLIPSGEMPTYHCSQFDNGREIFIDLLNGEDDYSLPEGYTAELHTRKMDGNIVTLATTSVSSNHLTFTSTEQLTACAGNNLSEVSIKDASDYVVGTLNFWLYVEKDPLQGGLTSTSSIHDLTDQIEEITTEIVGENYYNKSETDDLLDLKADKSTTYTKTEVNTLLNSKADASSVYTKSETNTLLSAKADASDVYTKSQVETKLAAKADADSVYTKSETDTLLSAKADANGVYNKVEVDAMVDDLEDAIDLKADAATTYTKTQVDTALALKADAATTYTKTEVDTALALKANAADVYTKTEVDNIILDIMPVGTAGPSAIASFDTALAAPLQSVIVNVVATQASGTPTPSDPLPISGYTEANIVNTQNDSIVDLFSIDSDFRGTVAFNQLAKELTSGNYTAESNVTASYTDGVMTFSSTQVNNGVYSSGAKYELNHKYFITATVKTASNINLKVGRDGFAILNKAVTGDDTWHTIDTIDNSVSSNANTRNNIYCTTTYTDVQVKNVMIIDLTAMFGSTIADYIYGLEQNNAGEGVAFFRSIYSEDYYAYDSGTTEIVGKETPEATISFGQTVYGGVLDVTNGTLTVTHDNIASYNGESINEPWLSSMDVYVPNTTPTIGAQVVYPLTTPVTLTLTSEQIRAIVGTNNVYSDTNGNTTVKFKDSIQHYIDTHTGG